MIAIKKWFDIEYFKIALYVIFIIVIGTLFYQLIGNISIVSLNIKTFLNNIKQLLKPLLYGILFAYLMNPGASWFERKLYLLTDQLAKDKKLSNSTYKFYRTVSILLVYIVLFGFIFITFNYMVPKIFSNIKDLYGNMPNYINAMESLALRLEESMDYAAQYIPADYLDSILKFLQLPQISPAFINSLIGRIFSSALNITSITLNIVLACVIAFYLLKQKENFAHGAKRLIYAFFNKQKGDKLISLAQESNHIFIRFFIGKSLDSLIIGIICFIGLSLLKNPYALLLSLIVGVTNMIPYFGPFIGGVPAVLITLFEGFTPAILVAIFIFALQQFDGLFLGPKILGDSIGLSPFWIIISIIIGGAIWGVLGMFFGVPLCAIILLLINRWIDKRLELKNIDTNPLND